MSRLRFSRPTLLSLTALLVAAPAWAQRDAQPATPPSTEEATRECRRDRWNDDREQHCEVREYRLATPSRLRLDAGPNGGVRVRGWDRNEVLVRAIVRTEARTLEEARELAKELEVVTSGGDVRTEGPRSSWSSRRRSWSVSYEVWTPKQIDVDAESTNGGVHLTDVRGRLRAETTNGGVHLFDVAGDVHARATNGGVQVELARTRWEGTGLDAETTNGGVTLTLPDNFNGRLEAETTNGGFRIDFPITVQGRIGKRISTTLGSGGPLVRVATTNGGVTIRRR